MWKTTAVALVVVVSGSCRFDTARFDERRCAADGDCRPDETCTGGRCARRECQTAADCGPGHQYECAAGLCGARTCTADADCGLGFVCTGGFCAAGCPDHDGDGVGFGAGCSGVQDCNDADPDETPGRREGPAGDPTCSDGKDNDCNGAVDGDDPGCQPCLVDADCDDGKYCTGVERCVDHSCAAGTAVDCSALDDTACHVGVCDEVQAGCVAATATAGTPCSDGDDCTVDDRCDAAGGCGPGARRDADRDGFIDARCGGDDCDDDDPLVHPGAVEGPLPGDPTCSDGKDNDCDGQTDGADTACVVCSGPAECDDLNPCTDDSCQPDSTCLNQPDNTKPGIADVYACTSDVCVAGRTVHVPVDATCDDGNACTDDECRPGDPQADPTTGCVHRHNTAPCNDGDPCTKSDTCNAGVCEGTPYGCVDGRACTLDICNGDGTCSYPLVGGTCLIGGQCYAAGAVNPLNHCEECIPSVSTSSWSPDDTNTCGDGVCEHCAAGVCVNTPAGVLANGCTPDANPCTDDYCDGAGSCVHPNDDTNTCGDGICEYCSAGTCTNTAAGVLANGCTPDANPCTDDYCDGNGSCVHPANDARTCGDGICEYCSAGACTNTAFGVLANGCVADANPCTDDYCDGLGSCVHPNDDTNTCGDGICEYCSAGACTNTAFGLLANGCVADANPCTDDYCDGLGSCVHPNDDTNTCGDGICEYCSGGACTNTAFGVLANGCTADVNPCTDDYCDGFGNCVHPNDDTNTCSDAYSCTNDACSGGVCVGTAVDPNCPGGQLCRPACFGGLSGCGTAPSMTLGCPSPVPSGVPGSTCTISLGGLTGQTPCLSCTAKLGPTRLDYTTFTGCTAGAWTLVELQNTKICPTSFTDWPMGDGVAFEAGNSDWYLERTFNTTNMDNVRLCFKYAAKAAAATDGVSVYLNTGGGFPPLATPNWSDGGGPTASPNPNYIPTCLDLDALSPAAANNPSLGIRIRVTSGGAGRVAIDDVSVSGWQSSYVSFSTVFSDGFGTVACDLSQWVVTGSPTCPIDEGPLLGTVALEVENAAWSIATTVNASSLCDDVRVGFRHGTRAPNLNERMVLEFNAGAGFAEAFRAERDISPSGTFFDFAQCTSTTIGCSVSLSNLSASAAFNPSLGLRYTLSSNDANREVYLDDVSVAGAVCGSGDAYLTLGPLLDVGGGNYTIEVRSPAQTTAHLVCTWDSASPPVTARARIVFVP
ncbi:MAG: hypothetical protein HY906_13015 [Deltaproteobacteria bacterium]|nr:hypothetical protein [Deltaproteobacteria bacterium]